MFHLRLWLVACLILVPGQAAWGQAKSRVFAGHQGVVRGVVFTPDGKSVISGGIDNTLRRWDVASGKESPFVKGQHNWIVGIAISRDGKMVASTDFYGKLAHLWDTANGKELHKLAGHENYVHCVAFSPDGKTLASASYDQTVRLWDTARGTEIRRLTGHTAYIASVAFSPDGKLVASGGDDVTVRLWDAATGKQLHLLKGHTAGIPCLTFSPDGKTLASASHDGTIRLWEVLTAKERCQLPGHKGWVRGVRFAPDGKTLVTAGQDSTVRLWDAASGKERHKLEGHKGTVWSVAFSPNGKMVASASEDRMVRLWDVARLVGAKPAQPVELADKELAALWAALAATDAEKAYLAIGKLAADPVRSVPFLEKALLKKVQRTAADARRVAELIAQLDDDDFKVRDRAAEELARMGKSIKPALLKAQDETTSSEVGYRLRGLLKRLEGTPASLIRAMRAVEALEHAGGPEARKALTRLAREAAPASLKQDARAALARLTRQAAVKP